MTISSSAESELANTSDKNTVCYPVLLAKRSEWVRVVGLMHFNRSFTKLGLTKISNTKAIYNLMKITLNRNLSESHCNSIGRPSSKTPHSQYSGMVM